MSFRSILMESPLVRELVAEARQDDLLIVLHARFGVVPEPVESALRAIRNEHRLLDLIGDAARCPGLDSFRSVLNS